MMRPTRLLALPILVLGLAVAFGPGPVAAEEEPAEAGTETCPTPSAAWGALAAEVRGLPRSEQPAASARKAKAYLERWDAVEEKPEIDADDRVVLARMYQLADRVAESVGPLTAVMADDAVPGTSREQAALGLAMMLTRSENLTAFEAAEVKDDAVKALESYLADVPVAESAMRARTMASFGAYLGHVGDLDGALARHLEAARTHPGMVGGAARSIAGELLKSTHTLDEYAALRTRANTLLAELEALQAKALEAARADLEQAQADGATGRALATAQRAVQQAERNLERIAAYGVPFQMLGEPAQRWTLEHAFGDTQALADLEGQVVVLDFWATWCPWCIRSFPAVRDLLRDYGDKGLAVVGVTASAGAVYEQRYDLDEDLKDKATGERPQPVARLDTGREPSGDVPVFPAEEYKPREIAAIETFISNHEMDWPVVMIDAKEPSAKYALTGWPHAVVIDREGRIRYFKSGALLRDRPEQVAAFRKILEDLLAEPAAQD